MLKTLVAVTAILIGATVAWFILGATIAVRTQGSDSAQRAQLAAQWGSEQEQAAPNFSFTSYHVEKNKRIATVHDLDTASSRIAVDLALDQRLKGLIWYNTYAVRFNASYRVPNPGGGAHIDVSFPFPAEGASYDDFVLAVDGKRISVTSSKNAIVRGAPDLAPRHGDDHRRLSFARHRLVALQVR